MTVESFVSQQRSPHTRRAYLSDLNAWRAFLGSRTASEEVAVKWRDTLVEEYSISTALRMFTSVRAYYKWLGLNAENNPFARIKAPTKTVNWTPKVPTEEQVDAVIGACTDTRDRAILSLLNNGLRAAEVCGLRSINVAYSDEYGVYTLKVLGKGTKERIVIATEETVTALSNWTGGGDYLFPRLNIRKVYYTVKKWAKKAGVEDIHPHSFRHAYATRLIRNGVNVIALQRLLGHARTETTSLYAHLDLGALVEASKMDPRNRVRKPEVLREESRRLESA